MSIRTKRFGNPGVVAQGMLAPSGYFQDHVDPFVQSTVRPAGSILVESPGYDTIRPGKNRFQGKGPTGGFKPMRFAEDVGGTGAAISIRPNSGDDTAGDIQEIADTEWIPDTMREGSMIIADREHNPDIASRLHQGMNTLVDMGDRDSNRPLSKSRWLVNPIGMFRADLQESPAITVAATVGLVVLLHILATDVERQYRGYRGGGLGSTITSVPAAGVSGGGEAAGDAVDKIGKAADNAVNKIEKVTDDAVGAISKAASSATGA